MRKLSRLFLAVAPKTQIKSSCLPRRLMRSNNLPECKRGRSWFINVYILSSRSFKRLYWACYTSFGGDLASSISAFIGWWTDVICYVRITLFKHNAGKNTINRQEDFFVYEPLKRPHAAFNNHPLGRMLNDALGYVETCVRGRVLHHLMAIF